MISKTQFKTSIESVDIAAGNLPSDDFRLTINQPSGNFFYDPWVVKDEYKNTIWYHILQSLTIPHGEARIILLAEGKCYQSHADIDDRYHLNISGNDSYLINLKDQTLHNLERDGHWYYMKAGVKHTAANFGRGVRAQLVVRKLLVNGDNGSFVSVHIKSILSDKEEARFRFDTLLSPVFNALDKLKMMSAFSTVEDGVTFKVSPEAIDGLRTKLPEGFLLSV